jgi:signal transduction histidine kinase
MSDGGSLHVAIDRQSGDGRPAKDGLLRIVFRDTGSGIPEQVMSRLFEPFVTSKERGIGLGLAISRKIMQEHGGRLTASNAPPGGAMFVVEVPLAHRAVDPEGNGSASPHPPLAHSTSGDAACASN